MKRVNIAGWCRAAMLAVPMFVLGSGFVDTGVSYLNPSGGKVVPGEWNKNFDSALAMADKENIPLVAVYGGASCGACELFQQACIQEEFLAWKAKHKPILVFTTSDTDVMKFAKPEKNSPYADGLPYVAVYWNREGVAPEKGSTYYKTFSGKSGKMLVTGGTLTEQIIKTLDSVIGAYPYAAGEFLMTDGPLTTLEIEEGYAPDRKVVVPLTRDSGTVAALNYLDSAVEPMLTVNWAVGETRKYVEVSIPEGFEAGAEIPLKLYDDSNLVHATSKIKVVAEPENAPINAKWIGEDFAWGEWTMDYTAAKAKVQAEGGHLLAMFSGVLWCPYCYGMDTSLLSSDEFKQWARDNKVALVLFDQSRASSPATAAGSGLARLLNYEIGTTTIPGRATACGASYLTRKNISLEEAQPVIDRVTEYTAKWLAPGATAARLGNPTILLINPGNETVIARLNGYRNTDKYYFPEENVCRLDNLLRLESVGEDERNAYVQTTELSGQVGGIFVSQLEINVASAYHKLEGIPNTTVKFTDNVNDVMLSLVSCKNGKTTTLVKETAGTIRYAFKGDEGDCYLRVRGFAESKEYGDANGFASTVFSDIVLAPTEAAASYTAVSAANWNYYLSVEEGVQYRLEGFTNISEEKLRYDGDAEEGGAFYTALVTEEIEFHDDTEGATTVTYQVWNPGEISFDESAITVFSFLGDGEISVTRKNGSSGATSVNIYVQGGDAVNGQRYVWDDDTVVSWADGEAGTKRVAFRVIKSDQLLDSQSFMLAFRNPVGTAAIADGILTVTLSDVDTPTLAKMSYNIDLFGGFDASAALDPQQTYNLTGKEKVTFKKVSGKLPSGVKLVYENGKVFLEGAARATGTFKYTFRMSQKQNGKQVLGPEITITINVASARDVTVGGNAMMNKSVKTTLPLYLNEGSKESLAGTLDITLNAKNKITAKYNRVYATKAVKLSGLWSTMVDGEAEAQLVEGKYSLDLTVDSSGRMAATLTDPQYDTALSSGDALRVGTGSFANAYKGYYTAAIIEIDADDQTGTGYVIIKSIAANGKASWTGALGNGQTFSGSSFVTIDDEGYAILPVLKRRAKDYVALALMIRPEAKEYQYPRAVKHIDGTVARWAHFEKPEAVHDCEVRGSWYNKGAGLGNYAYAQFGSYELLLGGAPGTFSSEQWGEVMIVPTAKVKVGASNMTMTGKSSDLKFKFNASKGTFSGTMRVQFEKKTVAGKFKGVVIPGWHDCGCEIPDPKDPFRISLDWSQPFAIGTLILNDTVDGVKVNRGFTVKVDELEEDE